MNNKGPPGNSLHPLIIYLSVLVERYPSPIRSVDLAAKADRTKAAITKVRQRLLSVCDTRVMALDKGFVLKADFGTFVRLFMAFVSSGRRQEFLSSEYAREFLTSDEVYNALASYLPVYSRYFTKEETNFVISKVLEALALANEEGLREFVKNIVKPARPDVGRISESVIKILESLKLPVTDSQDLMYTFRIRDKLFFLVRDFLWEATGEMDILAAVRTDERETYIVVYKRTIDFYLRKVFEAVNDMIKEAAGEAELTIEPESLVIGSTMLRQEPA